MKKINFKFNVRIAKNVIIFIITLVTIFLCNKNSCKAQTSTVYPVLISNAVELREALEDLANTNQYNITFNCSTKVIVQFAPFMGNALF